MGRVKEYYMSKSESAQPDLGKYVENLSPEQEISVGDTVRVYDSTSLLEPYEAVVLYKKELNSEIILTVDPCTRVGSSDTPRQVFDIQCRKVSKRMPRVLWLKFCNESKEYKVSVSKPSDESGWSRFVESI